MLAGLSPLVQAADSPGDWLARMANAVRVSNYEGTVIRVSDGKAEALKVLHTVNDGVIREKLVAQEGDGLEIIRNGNVVHCILPGRKSVLVEEWNDQSTLFSTLQASEIRVGNEYDVRIVREDRVAARNTLELAIKPHDDYRYEHRIWLDRETAFPLQTQLIDAAGDTLEQVKFVDIRFVSDFQAGALQPSSNIENFKWYNPVQRKFSRLVESEWLADDLPAGFRVMSVRQETMPATEELVTHVLYSDGLASVSVFIAEVTDQQVAVRSQVGASHSYSTISGNHRITAVGEVPAITVEQFANSMRLR